jgi:hypothetical protein
MTPRPVIITGTVGNEGTLRAHWEFRKGQLAFMRVKERNDLFRSAMVHAMTQWRAAFIPQRFTTYVKRSPFSYSLRGGETSKALASLGMKKDGSPRPGVGGHGALAIVVRGILARETMGWNPWGREVPPLALVEKVAVMMPQEFKGGWRFQLAKAYDAARAWSKRKLTDAFRNLYIDDIMQPLTLTGDLRAGAMSGKVSATATSNKIQGRVTVPFPAPRSARVGQIIRTVPHWEVGYIIRQWNAYLQASLEGTTVQAGTQTMRSVSITPRKVA